MYKNNIFIAIDKVHYRLCGMATKINLEKNVLEKNRDQKLLKFIKSKKLNKKQYKFKAPSYINKS